MTREVINELKKYTLGKKNTETVKINVLHLNRVIKALEQQPCEGMRDATEEERRSTKNYIDSISKPTGLQFDDIYEELDFVQPHKKISVKLNLQPCEDECITKAEVINTIHKTMYGFFDIADDDSEEPINDKDKLLLTINKAISNAVKALPSVTPQSFINKPCVSEGVCREDKIKVLDKIRAEIERRGGNDEKAFCKNLNESYKLGLREAIEIIDKYKAERSDKE